MNVFVRQFGKHAALGFCLFFFSVPWVDGARIWIDTDASIGSPLREVDDAFALVFAFHSPEVRIVGISTTFGNAGVKRTTFVSRELVRRFGIAGAVSEREVYEGCAAPRDLGKITAASEALARALRREKLTYFALGPLTNLASFLALHPELAERIESVIFVGGKSPDRALAFGPNGRLRIHDANVTKDPAAVSRVLESRIPLRLASVEVSRRLMLRPADAARLHAAGGAGEYLARGSRTWMWFWTRFVREEGGPLFDVLPLLAATRPEFIETERRHAIIDPSGDLIATQHATTRTRPVRFCVGLKSGAMSFMLERLVRRAVD